MKHPSDGEIRAYQDQALSGHNRQRIEAHLGSCPDCQSRAAALSARASRTFAHLSSLESDSPEVQTSVRAARLRLAARLSEPEKENGNMWSKMTSRVSRPAWIALAVIAVLTISLAFEPVRAVANSFLGLFRVEQIKIVQISPGDLPDQLGSSSQLEKIFTEKVEIEERGEPQEVASVEEASRLAGIPVRLPSKIEGERVLVVQPGGSLSFNVDLELIEMVLADIGRSDIKLPRDLDGATVKLEIPSGVMAQFGECEIDEEALGEFDPDDPSTQDREYECTTLMQMPSPTISAPPGLDMTRIGEAYLQVLGMSQEEAVRFARNVDWTTTFVIPIPRYGTEYKDVQVDGVTGTLIQHQYTDMYALMWVKDGTVYALSGPGNKAAALKIAGSMK